MSLPKIIYGTAWKKEATTALVVSAVLHGFRAIDTACQLKHYEEGLVGKALQLLRDEHGIKREDLFIQTKYTSIGGQDKSKPLPYNPADSITRQIQSSFQESLKNLGTTYLDSYILHSPLPTLDLTLEAWRTLMQLQDSGKVKLIGVSNMYDVEVLKALGNERKVQVVQNRWHEGNQWDREVVRYCKANGIFYQSFWTLTGAGSLLSNKSVLALAKATGSSTAQVIYKMAQLYSVVPISGTTNEQHMKDDVEIENKSFDLYYAEDVEAVTKILNP